VFQNRGRFFGHLDGLAMVPFFGVKVFVGRWPKGPKKAIPVSRGGANEK